MKREVGTIREGRGHIFNKVTEDAQECVCFSEE